MQIAFSCEKYKLPMRSSVLAVFQELLEYSMRKQRIVGRYELYITVAPSKRT